jgi:hypothetical protein
MPSVRFEPTISAGERPQTYALDGAATGTGYLQLYVTAYLKTGLKERGHFENLCGGGTIILKCILTK